MRRWTNLPLLLVGWISISLLSPTKVLSQFDEYIAAQDGWATDQVLPNVNVEFVNSRGRVLAQAGVPTVRGVPTRFTIRPIVDPSLCVHRVNVSADAVAMARARSSLPATTADEVAEYGSARLVLLPCVQDRDDTFLAEAVLGRFYRVNDVNYRQGFLKLTSDSSICVYGVNSSYTQGHPVFGVTGTEYYHEHPDASKGAATGLDPKYDDDMDWFDEYLMDYAPYVRYGYDPQSMVLQGVFKSPNPLPATMLDASGWGPFYSTWGTCMSNPTLDSSTPSFDPSAEAMLRYMSWNFIDATDATCVSHLPLRERRLAFLLLTLGPERPHPNMSPDAGMVDAGELSVNLGGGDKPYGTGYSTLISNELCLTADVVKAGAEVKLVQCNPGKPSVNNVFQLIPANRLNKKRLAAASG